MKRYRCIVLSVVKHDYIARAVATHPRFELVVVADNADRPAWSHERNQKFAREFGIPYLRDIDTAIAEYNVQVAIVSAEAQRHCELSARAANAGLHVIQDKPMSNSLSECDRLVKAVERNQIKFLMWNRNFLPAVQQAREIIAGGAIGTPFAIHVDFFFAKNAGPPKGSRGPGEPALGWLQHQIAAHATSADGGLGTEPMGELQIEGVYPLAYIQLLTGARIRRVFARTAMHFHQVNFDNGVDDLATVTLEMDRGMIGSICVGRIGEAAHPDLGEIKIHVLGSKGGLVILESRPEVAIYYRDQPAQEFRHRRIAVDNDYLQVDGFVQAIETGCSTGLDVRSSRTISAVVQAALESAKTASPVELS